MTHLLPVDRKHPSNSALYALMKADGSLVCNPTNPGLPWLFVKEEHTRNISILPGTTVVPVYLSSQPTPIGTEGRVAADIAQRQAHGLVKYGKSVEENPLSLRQWLQHSYEEKLDDVVYMKRAIEEIDKKLQ